MFNTSAKRETIYDAITGALPASALGIETKYQRSVRRQIARCIAFKVSSASFEARSRWHSFYSRPRARGASKREENRARLVADALREAGL